MDSYVNSSIRYDNELIENNNSMLQRYLESLSKEELIAHKVPVTNFTNFLNAVSFPVSQLTVDCVASKNIFNIFLKSSPDIRMTQFFKYKTYLKRYIIFCNGEENGDVVKQMDFPDNFFYFDENDLLEDIEYQIEVFGEEPYDKYETFKCLAILLWLGCSLDDIVSIKLSDVSKDSIFVPLNNKIIDISDLPEISEVLLAYKSSDGYHTYKKENLAFETYKSDFFIRTAREAKDHKTTVFNICRRMNELHISKPKITESGFVRRLYLYECTTGNKPRFNDSEWLKQFGSINRTSAKYAYALYKNKLNKAK